MSRDLYGAITGRSGAAQPAFSGPVEAVKVATPTGMTGVYVEYRTKRIGPCQGAAGAAASVGDSVLVLMVGGSLAHPWIVAVA